MSNSDRSLIVAAIFGLIAIPFGFGLALGGDWTGKPYEQTEKPYASAADYAASNIAEPFAAYPIAESNRCYAAKDHDSADLCAQWRAAIAAEKSANSAMWANRLSVIGAILSAFGLAFLLKSLRQTDSALKQAKIGNKLAEDTARRQLRAYLYPSRACVRFARDNGVAIKCPIDIFLKNSGGTPAKIIRYKVEIQLSSPETIIDAEEVGGVSNIILRKSETKLEKIVGPDTEIYISFRASANAKHFRFPPDHSLGGMETVLFVYFWWDYIDYLGEKRSEFAEFTTDAVDFIVGEQKEVILRQSRASGELP